MIVLAHAFGARYDLPIPLALFVIGGGVVVLLSFALSGRSVHPPRSTDGAPTHPDDQALLGRLQPLPTTIGLVVLAFVVWAGLVGSQEIAENVLPTTFWLLAWIAVPLSCGIAGDWTRPLNPFAALARLADCPSWRAAVLGDSRPVRWPDWLGWWPAVVLFFLAACGELVFNLTMTVPRNTALALIAYAILSAFCGLLFGTEWLRRGELFTVLFSTWGRLGYFRFGAPGRRGFAGGLIGMFDRSVSRICFVLLLLISVNFDGLLATPSWSRLEDRVPGQLGTHAVRLEAFRTATFILLALGVATVFAAFATASARVGGADSSSPGDALANLLPSLVPIAFGYLLVHNLQYVLVNSQLMAPLIGNPIGKESWPMHLPYPFNDGYEVHNQFLPSAFYWYAGVVVIVAVHVVAVVIARQRLARPEGAKAAHRSEYPWLVAMVGYTMLSLWLIAQPLVKEKASEPATGSAAPAVVSVIS